MINSLLEYVDMMRLIVFYSITTLFACKKTSTQVLAVETLQQPSPSQMAIYSWDNSRVAKTLDFVDLIEQEKKFTELLEQKASSKKHGQLPEKIQHHMRSIIAYAVHSRCFKPPCSAAVLPVHMRPHLMERDWRDRYDYNYYKRGNKSNSRGFDTCGSLRYKYEIRINNDSLCSIFFNKLRELSNENVNLSQSNKEFFQKVMVNKVKSLNTNEMQDAQQKFFREDLAPRIIKITEQSMAHSNYLFPFHQQTYVKACEEYRDHRYDSYDEHTPNQYRFSQEVRTKINCNTLNLLAIQEKATTKPFTNLHALSNAVIDTVKEMNIYRTKLDELVKLRKIDELNPTRTVIKPYVPTGGGVYTEVPNYISPHVEKKPWILPFIKVLNATKVDSSNTKVIEAIDNYKLSLIEAGKKGVLPIIFANAVQKKIGSLHLNHMDRFFGFGQVEYKQLKQLSHQDIEKAIAEVKHELIVNWVKMQATLVDTKTIDERKIYGTILNNEIAVAQLLLQNPTHAVVITNLLHKFQHKPVTPKWLRTFKNFSLATDLIFIPIAILGGFVTGGVGTIPLLLMANAVNFLWIGSAAAEQLVARNRYRMVEQALLTGTSEQVERGMAIMREFHEKQRNLIVSGAIGAPLTLGNRALIANSLDNLASIPIDILAAFSADIETIAMPEEKSDASLHNEK